MVHEDWVWGTTWTFPLREYDHQLARANYLSGAGNTEGQDEAGKPLIKIRFRLRRRTRDTVGRPILPSNNH